MIVVILPAQAARGPDSGVALAAKELLDKAG
jgi:hypothetical protein